MNQWSSSELQSSRRPAARAITTVIYASKFVAMYLSRPLIIKA
jgi:hypothetical protein